MSDQSDLRDELHDRRRGLLKLMARRCCRPNDKLEEILENGKLKDLEDGQMGSFAVDYHEKKMSTNVVCTANYQDVDGVAVHISLFVDASDLPTEVEIWKTDFEPIIEFPTPNRVESLSCASSSISEQKQLGKHDKR